MKTTILSLVVIFGCIVPVYSQKNHDGKADEKFSFDLDKGYTDLSRYKFLNGWSGSFKGAVFRPVDSLSMMTQQFYRSSRPSFIEHMPCLKPEGNFSMRVYRPDPNSVYTILLKKF